MELYLDKSGTGNPLIMLHGMFGSFENLGAISRILQEHFTLYRLDLRNHGRSPHADTMTFAEMAKDVVELMDRENLSSAHILGHSLGGKTAMQIAFDYPERVDGLVVLDIAPVTYPAHHNAILDALQEIDPSQFASRSDIDKALEKYIDEAGVRQFILKNLNRDNDGKFYWRINVNGVVNCYDSARVAIGDGQQYQKPVLFLSGKNSNYIQERNHADIFQKFPNAKIETIDNASHWLHAEQPAIVAEQALRFFQSVK